MPDQRLRTGDGRDLKAFFLVSLVVQFNWISQVGNTNSAGFGSGWSRVTGHNPKGGSRLLRQKNPINLSRSFESKLLPFVSKANFTTIFKVRTAKLRKFLNFTFIIISRFEHPQTTSLDTAIRRVTVLNETRVSYNGSHNYESCSPREPLTRLQRLKRPTSSGSLSAVIDEVEELNSPIANLGFAILD